MSKDSKMKDYPAAHSADTLFYMVDECGHVVACYSNESGAIATNAVTDLQTHEEDNGHAIWEEGDRFALETVAPSHVHHLAKTFAGRHKDKKYMIGGMFYILSEYPKAIEEMLIETKRSPGSRPIVREIPGSKDTDGKKYYLLMTFSDSDGVTHEKIHDLGICVACTVSFTLRAGRVGSDGEAIPYYDHPSANCHAYPYMLQYVPEELKTVDELALSDGEKASLKGGPVIGGCFLKKPFWQPHGDVDAELYGDDYTAISMRSKEFKNLLYGPFGYW